MREKEGVSEGRERRRFEASRSVNKRSGPKGRGREHVKERHAGKVQGKGGSKEKKGDRKESGTSLPWMEMQPKLA